MYSKENSEQICLEADGILYPIWKQNRTITINKYEVYEGIDLIYIDMKVLHHVNSSGFKLREAVIIDYCREGYLEYSVGTERLSLSPGDVMIHQQGREIWEEVYPTNQYQGIRVLVEPGRGIKSIREFLKNVDVDFKIILNKFLSDEKKVFALHQFSSIEHIFSELYTLPEFAKKGYFKIKVLEFFLFLNMIDPKEKFIQMNGFSKKQANLAKDICAYLEARMDQHITLIQLAEKFEVSTTQIQKCFQSVYGTSVYAYMRNKKMHAAARLLQKTDRTILDIANQFGYENGGKFASAFRTVMGISPTKYRKGCYRVEDGDNKKGKNTGV